MAFRLTLRLFFSCDDFRFKEVECIWNKKIVTDIRLLSSAAVTASRIETSHTEGESGGHPVARWPQALVHVRPLYPQDTLGDVPLASPQGFFINLKIFVCF